MKFGTLIGPTGKIMNLTALLIPSLTNQLRAVSGWLDKAEEFAAGRGEAPDALLALRLAPDMFPLTTQLRFLAFSGAGAGVSATG